MREASLRACEGLTEKGLVAGALFSYSLSGVASLYSCKVDLIFMAFSLSLTLPFQDSALPERRK